MPRPLKNLCFWWCEFQSRLLFIISLLLRTFLTALYVTTVAWDGHLHCGTMYGLPICPWAQSVFSRLFFFFFYRICRTTVCWDLEFFSTLAENSDERAGGVGFRLATSWLGERRRSEGRSRREGKRAIPLHVTSRNRKRALTKSSVGYNMGRSGSQSSG